jgi:toxin ParE1/3/4
VSFLVNIIADAKEDIIDIYDYIVVSDSIEKAEYAYKNIKENCFSLSELPNRGHFPPELERIGIYEYREILLNRIELYIRLLNQIYIFIVFWMDDGNCRHYWKREYCARDKVLGGLSDRGFV